MFTKRKTIGILSMTALVVLALFYYFNNSYLPKVNADVNVTGDVFTGALTGGVNIGSGAMVTRGAAIYRPNKAPLFIPSYTFNTSAYNEFTKKLDSSRDRLKKGKNAGSCNFSGVYNLNPSNIPEGQLWYCNGPLTIGNVAFIGKGTIYVTGKLTINGNLTYGIGSQVNSLGVMAEGDIDIESGVSQLSGVYYSKGTINIK